jgi:hypothetical protein
MATRSTIALEFADGTVEQVYCHWDGYLSNNGKILAKHYSNPFLVRDLIDLGNISSLKEEIGEKHAFSHFDNGMTQDEYYDLFDKMTTFYTRDRSEQLSINKFADYADYVANHQYEEFEYILRNVNGKAVWFVDCGANGGYVTLETALINMKETV